MASRRMLSDSVHLFNYIGEVNDVAQYQESIIHNCKCIVKKGAGSGKTPSDSAKLYVFDYGSTVKSVYGQKITELSPEEWENCTSKSWHYTFSTDGKDYFEYGGEKFTITSVSHRVAGSRRMWHYELEAR